MIFIYVGLGIIIILSSGLLFKMIRDKHIVKAYIVMSDRRVKVVKQIPKDNHISYNGGLYDIDNTNFVLSGKIPTYFYDFKNPKPLEPYTRKATEYSPQEYHDAINSKIVKDIVNSQKQGLTEGLGANIITIVIIVGIVGIVAYLGNEKLVAMQEQINKILELLGGAN